MDELTKKRLRWFGGNAEGLALYQMFIDLSHTWDDLIDGDNVPKENINNAFKIALIYLPSNSVWRAIQNEVLPMFDMVVSAWEVANKFESEKDEHGIEIAHGLRYAAGHILAYALTYCVGRENAKLALPELWKDIYFERLDDYKSEHLA